jgi:hypothetical protein
MDQGQNGREMNGGLDGNESRMEGIRAVLGRHSALTTRGGMTTQRMSEQAPAGGRSLKMARHGVESNKDMWHAHVPHITEFEEAR